MEFSANYFNGKSSKTYKATVRPNNQGWTIVYEDELIGRRQLSWRINEIKKSEVYTKGLISFNYGNSFPFQKIEINDPKFIKYIESAEHKNLNNKVDTWLHRSRNKSIVLLLIGIVTVTYGIYFHVIPSAAESFTDKLPKKYVTEFGDYVFGTMVEDLDIDEIRSEQLQQFVNKLKLTDEFPLTVYVVNNKEMNAFALSGGKFVIYSGLLEKITSEHQLAALIGHEVSHINKRHVLKSVARSISGGAFLSILVGDVDTVTSMLLENAHQVMELSYSRSLEKEADIVSLEILKNNNLDQHGMPELFQILKEHHDSNIPSFLSTHPMLGDRIEYSKKIADNQKSYKQNKILKQKWEAIQQHLPKSKAPKKEQNTTVDE